MNTETLKILEMVKSGDLSTDEAARLIEALNKQEFGEKEAKSSQHQKTRGPQFSFSKEDSKAFSETFSDLNQLGGFIQDSIKGALGALKSATRSDQFDNDFSFSKSQSATGENYKFESNSVNLSKLEDLQLFSSEFSHNSLNACKIRGVNLKNSKVLNSSINGSGVSQIVLEDSEWKDTSINGSKIDLLNMRANSKWIDCSIDGTKIKNVTLENVIFENVSLTGLKMESVTLRNVQIKDQTFTGVKLTEGEFNSTEEFLAAIAN